MHKLTPGSVTNHLCALRFFYIQTLKRPWSIADTPYPKKRYRLPTILSQEEVAQLIEAAPTPLYRTILMTLCGTGVRRTAKIGSSIPNHPSADPSTSCSISAAIPTASPSPTIAWSRWSTTKAPFAGVTLPTILSLFS